MNGLNSIGAIRSIRSALALGATSVLILAGLTFISASPASAAGTTANTITASTAPATGSVGGSYTPSAAATSGDQVVITLDHASKGCSITAGKVSFTGVGTCRVDFNDAGNTTYAAAFQVQQSIKISAGSQKTQAALTLTSTSGIVGSNLQLTSKGGSGTGAVSYAVTNVGTAGCSISGTALSATKAGTCTVTVTKAADANYLVAYSSATTVSFTVSATGHKTQAALTLTSTSGIAGNSLTLTSKGGSGTGAVSYAVTNVGTAECSISGTVLRANKAGTCTVTVTKAGDANYKVAHSPATTVTFTGHSVTSPKAIRMGSAVWTGKSVVTTIIGLGFYGQPRIFSNVGGTRVGVLHDTGHVLTIRVTVAATTPRGVHTFTIVFLHGQRTSVKYNQR
jgi:hypothetical protein